MSGSSRGAGSRRSSRRSRPRRRSPRRVPSPSSRAHRSPTTERISSTAGSISSIVVEAIGITATAVEPSSETRPCSSAPGSSGETTGPRPADRSTCPPIAARSASVRPPSRCQTTSAGTVLPERKRSSTSSSTARESAPSGRNDAGSFSVEPWRRGWRGPSASAAKTQSPRTTHLPRRPAAAVHILCIFCRDTSYGRANRAAWPWPTPTQSVARP